MEYNIKLRVPRQKSSLRDTPSAGAGSKGFDTRYGIVFSSRGKGAHSSKLPITLPNSTATRQTTPTVIRHNSTNQQKHTKKEEISNLKL
jgi:hypothetical protein